MPGQAMPSIAIPDPDRPNPTAPGLACDASPRLALRCQIRTIKAPSCHACRATPKQATPRLPHHAALSGTVPGRFGPSHAMPAEPCLAVPWSSMPCLPSQADASRTLPWLASPYHACQAEPDHAIPNRTEPNGDVPSLSAPAKPIYSHAAASPPPFVAAITR